MQFLVFHIGGDPYGLNTRHLVRVLPLMELKQMPGTPPYVAGLMNFHGAPIPVIDLCMLSTGTECVAHFDTRILLADYNAGGARHLLGLVVERVTGLKQFEPAAFLEPGVSNANAPFLGKVASSDGAILQLVDIEHLLDTEARAILFPEAGEAAR